MRRPPGTRSDTKAPRSSAVNTGGRSGGRRLATSSRGERVGGMTSRTLDGCWARPTRLPRPAPPGRHPCRPGDSRSLIDADIVDGHALWKHAAAGRVTRPVAADRDIQDHEHGMVEHPVSKALHL